MSEHNTDLGRMQHTDAGIEGQLGRTLAHPPATVWAFLVESEKMAQWLAPGRIAPQTGGAVHIDFADSGTVIDSQVTAYEAGRLLEYSWSSGNEPARPLRWELAALADGGTRLALTVRIPAGEDAAKACAGFEGHLDMLAAALEGVPIKFPFARFIQARTVYNAQLQG